MGGMANVLAVSYSLKRTFIFYSSVYNRYLPIVFL